MAVGAYFRLGTVRALAQCQAKSVGKELLSWRAPCFDFDISEVCLWINQFNQSEQPALSRCVTAVTTTINKI